MPRIKPNKKAEMLVSGITVMHDEALELAEAVLFMAMKLEEARKELVFEPLTVSYDYGSGQTGIKENPKFTAYEKMLSSFTKSLKELSAIIEKGKSVKQASSIMAELSSIAGRKAG
jgi:hypothetical protein